MLNSQKVLFTKFQINQSIVEISKKKNHGRDDANKKFSLIYYTVCNTLYIEWK